MVIFRRKVRVLVCFSEFDESCRQIVGTTQEHRGIFMKKTVIFIILLHIFNCGTVLADWNKLDAPGASWTEIRGIDGENFVGHASNNNDAWGSGFLYDGTSWTMLNTGEVWDIDGGNLVGSYGDASGTHGFLYDGTSRTTLNFPGADYTIIHGIDGGNIVGGYGYTDGSYPENYPHGFLYDGTNWTTIDFPGADYTYATGIDGGDLVGIYGDGSCEHGFLYDGTNWTALDFPGAATSTWIFGIDGDNLVGAYPDGFAEHGLFYDGSNWTVLDAPGEDYTRVYGIDGDNLVGVCYDMTGAGHGFVYEIPEPGTVLFLGLGMILLRRRR
jgi:hypothetical protein